MKPEQLLDPETLPDDLRWLAAEFKLSPKDPVFLLIAWHWHRVQEAEDSLRTATVEFQATVDTRVKAITAAAEKTAALHQTLGRIVTMLEEKPALMKTQLDEQLTAMLAKVHASERSMTAVVSLARQVTERARSRELLAAVIAGVVIGGLGAFLTFCA